MALPPSPLQTFTPRTPVSVPVVLASPTIEKLLFRTSFKLPSLSTEELAKEARFEETRGEGQQRGDDEVRELRGNESPSRGKEESQPKMEVHSVSSPLTKNIHTESDSKLKKHRSESEKRSALKVQALRKQLEALWSELGIPQRDRSALYGRIQNASTKDALHHLDRHVEILRAHRHLTLQALQAIEHRESALQAIKHIEEDDPAASFLVLVSDLLSWTLTTVNSIISWREVLTFSFPFRWRGVDNYLLKMRFDFENLTQGTLALKKEVVLDTLKHSTSCLALLLPTHCLSVCDTSVGRQSPIEQAFRDAAAALAAEERLGKPTQDMAFLLDATLNTQELKEVLSYSSAEIYSALSNTSTCEEEEEQEPEISKELEGGGETEMIEGTPDGANEGKLEGERRTDGKANEQRIDKDVHTDGKEGVVVGTNASLDSDVEKQGDAEEDQNNEEVNEVGNEVDKEVENDVENYDSAVVEEPEKALKERPEKMSESMEQNKLRDELSKMHMELEKAQADALSAIQREGEMHTKVVLLQKKEEEDAEKLEQILEQSHLQKNEMNKTKVELGKVQAELKSALERGKHLEARTVKEAERAQELERTVNEIREELEAPLRPKSPSPPNLTKEEVGRVVAIFTRLRIAGLNKVKGGFYLTNCLITSTNSHVHYLAS